MGPQLSFAEYIEYILRLSVAYGFLLLLFFLNIVSVPYPVAAFFKAPLLLVAIYYWSIYRPTLLPPWLVFIAGVLFDILTGAPFVGMSAVLFLLCRMAVIDQRRFLIGQNFSMVWFGFCGLNIIYHFVQWGLFSALNGQWLYARDFIQALVLGVFLFPVVYLFLFLTHKTLPEPVSATKSRFGSPKPNIPL